MMIVSVLGFGAALLCIWALGYSIVLAVAHKSFGPASSQAAVALLLGTCVAGVVLIGPAMFFSDSVWFEPILRWTVPVLALIGSIACVIRYRSAIRSAWSSVQRREHLGTRLWVKTIMPWTSALLLLVGAAAVIAYRPAADPALEFYGTRSGNTIQVTVASTFANAQNFVVVVRSANEVQPLVTRLTLAGNSIGSATIGLSTPERAHIDLYRATDNLQTAQPIRWIEFAGLRETP